MMLDTRPGRIIELDDLPASFPSGPRWYALYTRIRAERAVGKAVGVLGYPTFVPLERRWLVYRGKWDRGKRVPYECALFPRYLFVQFDINHPEWGAVVKTKGVVDLVRTNNIPRSIPDHVIEALQLAESIGVFDRTQPPRAGTKVEVTEGPYAGFIGEISDKNTRVKRRVRVLLNAMGVETVVDIPLAILREA